MPNVQIRNLSDEVHRRLKDQAAGEGQSLNEFLVGRLSDIARTPTVGELAAEIARRTLYRGPSSASLIREDRDGR